MKVASADDQPPADDQPQVDEQPPAEEQPLVDEQPPADEQPPGEEQLQAADLADDEPPVDEQTTADDQPPGEEQPPADDQVDDQPPVHEQPSADGVQVQYEELPWNYTNPHPKLEAGDILAFAEDKSLLFMCNFCDERFPSYEEMQVHRGAHLGDGPIDPNTGLPMSPSSSDHDSQVCF